MLAAAGSLLPMAGLPEIAGLTHLQDTTAIAVVCQPSTG
jgi:hypothetical protein